MKIPGHLMSWARGRRFNGRVGILAGLTVGLAATFAAGPAPASAATPAGTDSADVASCARDFVFGGAKVRIDNCPDNGRASYGQITGSGAAANANSKYEWSVLYATLANGDKYEVTAETNENWARYFDVDVRSFHVCNWYWVGMFPPITWRHCSVEVNL